MHRYAHAQVRSCTGTSMQRHFHAQVHSCTCTFMHKYVHHAHVHQCTGMFMHMYVHAQVSPCTDMFMHSYVHAHVRSCTYCTFTWTYIYMNILFRTFSYVFRLFSCKGLAFFAFSVFSFPFGQFLSLVAIRFCRYFCLFRFKCENRQKQVFVS